MRREDSTEWKEFFLELVSIMEQKACYADVLLIAVQESEISKDKTAVDVSTTADTGVKLRAFNGEQFFEYGTAHIHKEELRKQANLLAERAKKKTSKITLALDTESLNTHFLQKGVVDEQTISLQEKVSFVKKMQQDILSFDAKIVNAKVRYEELVETKIFVNKYKQLSQEIHGCLVVLVTFVQTDEGETRYNYKSFFKAGYEVTNIPENEVRDMCAMSLHIAVAKKITPGKYLAILSPEITGLLAHESFGHGMESDTMYKERAKAVEYVGKQIAPSFVSIIENPALPEKHGTYFFDDEGFLTSPTYLIKDGVVHNPITELYSATRAPFPRSGNGRCESYDHKTYARMSNIYFAVGTTNPEDMLAQVQEGIYLHHASGGMEDPKGWGTQIQGCVGEIIRNGKLTGEFLYEIGISGYLPTILGNILAVGSAFHVEGSGTCGKGHKEWVRVSDGGPHVLVKDLPLS